MTPDSSILIAGAGTFGLSTSYHLAKAGYKNITVLEKSPTIPSHLSAGNDLNKILRAEYEDAFYTELALQAMREWKDNGLFAPHYHETGYLLCTSAAAPEKSKRTLAKSLSSVSSHPAFQGGEGQGGHKIICPINTRDDIRAVAPALDGPMQGWTGYLNRFAGYAHAADALRAMHAACCALGGVTFRLGDGVTALVYSNGDDAQPKGVCIGARTASGAVHTADVVVLALGAALGTVLGGPHGVGRHVAARAWSVGHVQLSEDEASRLRRIPVTYARDLGFFFEPDARTRLLKVCPAGAGYTNFVSGEEGREEETAPVSVSVPPEDSGWIPARDEAMIRRLLRETLPALADRPIVDKKLCWCADTADTDYIIDFVPGKGRVVVVSGDSGHAFKMLPVVGNWVKDVLEKGRQDIPRWRWKEGQDAGGDVSWRVGESIDIKDVKETVRG
ncbi:FAD dependent oxidoreductase [Achaetomium macrosporum]|uniref:FAD dependent oxidoreductase n=1 Tax=Achaetomium macrosporum TaxID=79813 RepID=A0AAN7H7I8_9PEZI|nr:FAD dependent oxidoreductase [Achaetomium macrosporum]